jgi:hypothetical protein
LNCRSKLLAALGLSLAAAQLHAEDILKNVTRDALRMVVCIKALDEPCAQSLTYTKFFEEKGLSRAQLDQKVADVYQSLRSIGATYSSFDLSAPWQQFSLNKLTYAFVPYSYRLLARGETTQVQAFFIGVSEDSGSTWKFMDGLSVTPDNIDLILPGFHGGMLPPKSLTQSSAK